MIETLFILPLSFWAVIALLIPGGIWCFTRLKDGTGLPMLAVLVTTASWYVGDAFYNNYKTNHARMFDTATLRGAWWQVVWFLLVFLLATPGIHRLVNARRLHHPSGVMQLFKHGVGYPAIQHQLKNLFWICVWVWIGLSLIAIALLQGESIYYFFPFLKYKASPWSHGRMGAGFDALSVIAIYLQMLAASMFGVVAALTKDSKIRRLALLFCLLAWPYFIFDRTRNTILAVLIPGALTWVFLRLRGGILKKGLVLLAFFLVVNTWMKFVIANRDTATIAAAFQQKGLSLRANNIHNEGLNMFEELCWISKFIDKGTYRVNWGKRYFAELVNPIPRGLWPGKPLIGIDYAIARGQGATGADLSAAGVYATISTGFIGQGVVNFGRFFGPAAAALLMSLWVAWLARLDLNVQALGYLPLYSLGLILTFNLGRDITLITLYPFVFGALVVWWLGRHHPQPAKPAARGMPSRAIHAMPSSARTGFVRQPSAGGFVKRNPANQPGVRPRRMPR